MKRRDFVKNSLAAPGGLAAITGPVSRPEADPGAAAAPVDIGSRLELLVDRHLVERTSGAAALRLHAPVACESAIVFDRPWELPVVNFVAAFRDGARYRMYYRALPIPPGRTLAETQGPAGRDRRDFVCYAESADGTHWQRPDLGLFEFAGSRRNNIVWSHGAAGMFAVGGMMVFRDDSPGCAPEARYKALVARDVAPDPGRVHWASSPDGIRWSPRGPIEPATHSDGPVPAFWDDARGEYRRYQRAHRRGGVIAGAGAFRDVQVAVSKDFVHWSAPAWIEYPDYPEAATEQLYTNNIAPYHRAPHLLLGFPTRYVERPWTPAIDGLPEQGARRAYVRLWGGRGALRDRPDRRGIRVES